ncbi:hypothetical protein HDIA_0717 [Hartmannibacter diazotrophicus]|uniref:Uncharacterized protein n=1 Tax=Hartmannibacter diazotrophicus TaxID=1482074 RepID=A0A2C9D285_9HYPH|nr:hypothetical protein HDIA_0717 [Hartmannibacter diazotrophicus]
MIALRRLKLIKWPIGTDRAWITPKGMEALLQYADPFN